MFQGESFPLLTTKRVFWRGVLEELLWFLGREAFRLGEKRSGNNFVADFQKKDSMIRKNHSCPWMSVTIPI